MELLLKVVFCWLLVRGIWQLLVALRTPLWLPAFILLFSAILKISTLTFSIFDTFVQIKEQKSAFSENAPWQIPRKSSYLVLVVSVTYVLVETNENNFGFKLT